MILSESSAISVDSISSTVVQPVDALTRTLQLLNEQGLVKIIDNKVCLTPNGSILQNRLFTIAKQHEESLLSKVTTEQAIVLKDALKAIVGV